MVGTLRTKIDRFRLVQAHVYSTILSVGRLLVKIHTYVVAVVTLRDVQSLRTFFIYSLEGTDNFII